jgi:hypothetical protein
MSNQYTNKFFTPTLKSSGKKKTTKRSHGMNITTNVEVCLKCGDEREVIVGISKSGKMIKQKQGLFCSKCVCKAYRYDNGAKKVIGKSLIDEWLSEQLPYYKPEGPYVLKCECGNEQTYSTKYSLVRVVRTSNKCGKCSSAAPRQKWSGLMTPVTDEHRRKLRKAQLKHLSKVHFNGGQVMPGYNISSIPILEEKAKELDITDLQHAENGGEFFIEELGYYVDGYSKEKNIVIEYNEKYHRKQMDRDERRRKEIIKHLNMLEENFIIIWEDE